MVAAHLLPDQRLQVVEAVDHHGLERMLLVIEGGQGFDNLCITGQQWEGIHLQFAQAVFGAEEDRRWSIGSQRRFSNAGITVQQNARRTDSGRAADGA